MKKRSAATGVRSAPQPDERLEKLARWLADTLGERDLRIEPASADASFRRYFRLTSTDSGTRIAMDAPPEREDCRPFVRIAGLARDAGLHVPEVLATNLDEGFLLLSDLGSTTYLAALTPGASGRTSVDARRLMSDATEALVRWQLASRAGVLPLYDATILDREVRLFDEWYLARHLGAELSGAEVESLVRVRALLVARALSQPRVWVHRDYMPRNLMLADPNPGVLDFQDALEGPITYDIASLWRDAFISWPEEQVLDGCARYWERARSAGLPVDPDFAKFYEDIEWMGLQRHLKVLGIFARIFYRDGKPAYLADTPRFVRYARATAERYDALLPLAKLLARLHPGTEFRPEAAAVARPV